MTVMSQLATLEAVKAAFEELDVAGTGQIAQEHLAKIIKSIDPAFPDEDLRLLAEAAGKGKTGLLRYKELVDSVHLSSGCKLPEGSLGTTRSPERVHTFLSHILGVQPEEFGSQQVSSRATWLAELGDVLDATKNPSDFRICQAITLARDAVPTLLGLASEASRESIRSKCLEVLARLVFDNEAAAAEVAHHPQFVTALRQGLGGDGQRQRPRDAGERLSALVLAQAVAASAVADVAPELLKLAAPWVRNEQAFETTRRAAFDIVVSCSFHCPALLVEEFGWMFLLSLVPRSGEAWPCWLGDCQLTVLITGLVVANIIGGVSVDEHERFQLRARLLEGPFLDSFVAAATASAMRREWPVGSGAFHSPGRLARAASVLAKEGCSEELSCVIVPFSTNLQQFPDSRAERALLRALLDLTGSVGNLEVLLSQDDFRKETLEQLKGTEAVELNSYLAAADQMLQGATEALVEARMHNTYAPDVSFLAHIFCTVKRLEQELDHTEFLELLRLVPIGPSSSLQEQLSGSSSEASYSFLSFAGHVYGTSNIVGLWPLLVEDLAAELARLDPCGRAPALRDLLFLFELGSAGESTLPHDRLLEAVLPHAGLPAEGSAAVEQAFVALRQQRAMEFKAFARWMLQLALAVDDERRTAAATQVELAA